MQTMEYPWSKRGRVVLLCVLLVALALRAINFPGPDEVRDCDEIGYMESGLVLWEGITPGYKASPNGPQAWLQWMYAAGTTAARFVHPAPGQSQVPTQIRPFVSMDRALFDIYADMNGLHRFLICIQILVSLGGVYAAFRLGWHYAGETGALILGGVAACFPLFIDFSAMTRPYSDGWALSLLALYSAAAHRGRRRVLQTGIIYGLAIGSRIDMLILAPLVVWILWDQRGDERLMGMLIRIVVGCLLTLLLVAPWLVTNLVGNLRLIATIRVAGQFADMTSTPRLTTFLELFWEQGLALLLLAIIAGTVAALAGRRWRMLFPMVFSGLLVLSMFSGSYQPLRYHAAPLLALLLLGCVAIGELLRKWPRAGGVIMTIAVLALPVVQGSRQAWAGFNRSAVRDDAVAWIETHIPPGTTVYIYHSDFDLRPLLPTPQAADAIWEDVTNSEAWRRKFQRGLSRFNLAASETPRAMSEENLILDRSIFRRWFILGGQPNISRPRFDVRLLEISPTFGTRMKQMEETYAREGGVLVTWYENGYLSRPDPVVKWVDRNGRGRYIYCSPDIRAKLSPDSAPRTAPATATRPEAG